jgi:hypothetical protein
MMEMALGFAASGISVVALDQTDGRTCASLLARSMSGAKLYLDALSDASGCVLVSRLDEPDASWPPVFHRLAYFASEGPEVRLRLDTRAEPQASMPSTAWADLPQVASAEEKMGLQELLGLALVSLEATLANSSENAASRMLISSLQVRGKATSLSTSPDAYGLTSSIDVQGKALTALRTTVAEYYTSTEWEHVRLQLDGSTIAGVARDSLTFKIFRTPASVGLEFRPVLETGEHPFRSFPGSESDQFGQVYRITYQIESGELVFPEQETIGQEDRQLIDTIVEGLYATMRVASIGVGHLEDRVYAGWVSSGAAFSAAFRLAGRPVQSET